MQTRANNYLYLIMGNSSKIVKLITIIVLNVLAFENADLLLNASRMYHQSSTYSGHLFVNFFSAFCVNLIFVLRMTLGGGFKETRILVLVLLYMISAAIMNRISAIPSFWNQSTFIQTSLNFFIWYGVVSFFVVFFMKDFLGKSSNS